MLLNLVVVITAGMGGETSDSHKLDSKNQQEVIHWHDRYIHITMHPLYSCIDIDALVCICHMAIVF